MTDQAQQAETLLRQATELLKAGDKQQAKELVAEGLRLQPRSIQGWYLAVAATEDRNKQIRALEHILQLDPQDKRAKDMLTERRAEIKNHLEQLPWKKDPPKASTPPDPAEDKLEAVFYGLLGAAPPPSRLMPAVPRARARRERPDIISIGLLLLIVVVLVVGVLVILSMAQSGPTMIPTMTPTNLPTLKP